MKSIIAVLFLYSYIPVNAYESIGDRSNQEAYESQKGYALENKCFRYEYREYYVPGNSISPGYVKSYKEKISVPCNVHRNISNHYHYETRQKTSYANNKKSRKCNTSRTLGGLIGGGIAATLSKYSLLTWWSSPGIAFGSCSK